MRCPICKRQVDEKEQNRPGSFFPFCSERCKLIDLDHWLSGRYRISTPITSREESETTLAEQAPETEDDAKADCD